MPQPNFSDLQLIEALQSGHAWRQKLAVAYLQRETWPQALAALASQGVSPTEARAIWFEALVALVTHLQAGRFSGPSPYSLKGFLLRMVQHQALTQADAFVQKNGPADRPLVLRGKPVKGGIPPSQALKPMRVLAWPTVAPDTRALYRSLLEPEKKSSPPSPVSPVERPPQTVPEPKPTPSHAYSAPKLLPSLPERAPRSPRWLGLAAVASLALLGMVAAALWRNLGSSSPPTPEASSAAPSANPIDTLTATTTAWTMQADSSQEEMARVDSLRRTRRQAVLAMLRDQEPDALARSHRSYEQYADLWTPSDPAAPHRNARPAMHDLARLLRARDSAALGAAQELLAAGRLAQPDSLQARLYLGLAYYQQGQWPKAALAFQNLIDFYAQHDVFPYYNKYDSRWWLAQLRLHQGRWSAARQLLHPLARRPNVWQRAAQAELEGDFWPQAKG